ncbi:redox-sensing transcriptional repressor Rex [Rhodococcus sp. X156]|uniref:redox-sensing transcriptional repressor Rex n=1 Tax=Rhodococcus sp. X156 TaxID=2499145 RepID=UPI000FDC6C00|nr:redox-sensing transcriptional repressor Rex [Rhodococcus sp. X156]
MPRAGATAEAGESTVGASRPKQGSGEEVRAVPEATVARLALYLRVLGSLVEAGTRTVSSEELAALAGVGSAKLRKDLSFLGSNGTRGVGYDVPRLVGRIEQALGLNRRHRVALVGVGNLGHALAGYDGFADRGFTVTALFDNDPARVGTRLGELEIRHLDDVDAVCAELEISIGVVATPAAAAQQVCDRLVAAGVGCILNFAPVALQVPETVDVRRVDLAVEMQVLSFHGARRAAGRAAGTQQAGQSGATEQTRSGGDGSVIVP